MMDSLNRIGMALALTLTVMVAQSVHAAVLTSNLGELTASNYTVDNVGPEAQGFTTDASHLVLGSVSLLIDGVANAGGNFTVCIFNDNAGPSLSGWGMAALSGLLVLATALAMRR